MLGLLVWAFTLEKRPPPASAVPRATPAPTPGSVEESSALPEPAPLAPRETETHWTPPPPPPPPEALQPVFGFSAPQPLGSHFERDAGRDGWSRAVSDGQGRWMAVWTSRDPLGGRIGEDYDILRAVSEDGGVTWSDPEPVSHVAATDAGDDGGVTAGPDIATDAIGTWVVVWQAERGLAGALGRDNDILFARSTDLGVTWSEAAPVSGLMREDAADDTQPRIVVDGAGVWIVVWESAEKAGGPNGKDRDLMFTRSTDGGVSWSDRRPLNPDASTDTGTDRNAALATDRLGTWICAWESTSVVAPGDDDDPDIHFARSTDSGLSWEGPGVVNGDAGIDKETDAFPTIATNGSGRWIVVWNTRNDPDGKRGRDNDLVFSISEDQGSLWSAPELLHEWFGRDTGSDYQAKLACDGRDWLVVWESDDPLLDAIGTDIGKDVDLLVSRSADGFRWSPPTALLSNASIDSQGDHAPSLAGDGAGTWIATWTTTEDVNGRTGADFDVFFARSANLAGE